jgi:hypothetical protein
LREWHDSKGADKNNNSAGQNDKTGDENLQNGTEQWARFRFVLCEHRNVVERARVHGM